MFCSTAYNVLKSQDTLELRLSSNRGILKSLLICFNILQFSKYDICSVCTQCVGVFFLSLKIIFLLFGIKYKCILEKYIWQVFIRVFFDASFFGGVFFITVCNFTISSFFAAFLFRPSENLFHFSWFYRRRVTQNASLKRWNFYLETDEKAERFMSYLSRVCFKKVQTFIILCLKFCVQKNEIESTIVKQFEILPSP